MNINKPTTLTFSPEVLSFILDSLAERPFRQANPIIQDIFNQLKMQEVKEVMNLQPDKVAVEDSTSNGSIPVQ